MIKKILTLSLVAVMLSVTALASPDAVALNAVYVADEAYTFTAPGSLVTAVTERATVGEDTILNATHTAALPEAWDGVVAESIDTDANGTYLISNGGELAYFATVVAANSAANAKLDSDINLNSVNFNAYAVGGNVTDSNYMPYEGVFDGQGHTIYNLAFGGSQKKYSVALFRQIKGGTVKNVNFVGATMIMSTGSSSASHPHSIICARLENDGLLENIYVEGSISRFYNSPTYGRVHVFGAVCGLGTAGIIRNCISNVDVNFSAQQSTVAQINSPAASGVNYQASVGVGGIMGRGNHQNTTGVKVINCGNKGNITAPKHRFVGGVVGSLGSENKHQIIDCWNAGDIVGYGNVGGIVGYSKRGTTAYRVQSGNVYNTGDVIAVAEHNETDTLAGRTDDNPYAAGIGTEIQLNTRGYASYSVGQVYTKTAEDTDENILYVEAADGAYYNDGTKYVEITAETDMSTVTTRYNQQIGDGKDDDLGKDIYDAEADALTPDTVALLVANESTTMDGAIKHGLFYLANDEQAPLWWEKTETVTEGEGEEATTTTKTVLGAVYDGATALTEEQFKSQEAVDALNAYANSKYVTDIGINNGYPILQTQIDELVTDNDTYQVGSYNTYETVKIEATEGTEATEETITTAHNYELQVELSEAGYVSLDVKPFGAEKVIIKAYDTDGEELDSVTVTKAGIVTLATGENTDVVIKATQGRALINLDLDGVQTSGAAIAEMASGALQVNLGADEASTVAMALYSAEGKLLTVRFAQATPVNDGLVSAIIDLSDYETEGCTLKAFVWADGKLAPTGEVQILN